MKIVKSGRPLLLGLAVIATLALPLTVVTDASSAPGVRVPTTPCFWSQFDWGDLSPQEQNSWMILGWNQSKWDFDGGDPPSEAKSWSEMTKREQGALIDLGYTQKSWDNSPEC